MLSIKTGMVGIMVSLALTGSVGAAFADSGGPDTAAAIIASAGKTNNDSFCGKRKILLGIQDGVGTNGWSKTSMAVVRSEAAKCPNVEQLVEIGHGDLQKSIAEVNNMVAQGVDALVMIPDWGRAELASIEAATDAGVKVVPWGANPGGTPGKDYVAYVDWNPSAAGEAWAKWVAKAIHGKGNVVFIGGPAGNPVSVEELKGIRKVFEAHPGIKMLTGYKNWPAANWDAALIQQAMSALLAKYPKIDAVISDAGGFQSLGVVRAFEAAGRPLVPLASLEANALACTYDKLKSKNPGFQIGTISGRNWIGRIATRKAIAAAEGLKDNEPDIYNLGIFESTLPGATRAPICDKSMPPDAFLSAQLSPAQLKKYGTTN